MAAEDQREIYRALRDAQTRYTYFLLAAAGAAIGLAINQTQNGQLKFSLIPLGAAVLSWGLSFFCGCRHLAYVASGLYANATLLEVASGQHRDLAGQPSAMVAAASEGIRRALEFNANRANRYGHWQFRLLVSGALLFVGWHILEMYLRTP